MNKHTRIPLLLALITTLLLINARGQSHEPKETTPAGANPQKRSQSLDQGQLNGTLYTNSFFGLSLQIPGKWIVTDEEGRAAFDDSLKKLVDSPDQQKLDQAQNSLDRSKTLLRITKLLPGQPNNAQLILVAEIVPTPLIKNGLDALGAMKQAMSGTNFVV